MKPEPIKSEPLEENSNKTKKTQIDDSITLLNDLNSHTNDSGKRGKKRKHLSEEEQQKKKRLLQEEEVQLFSSHHKAI